MKDAIPHTTIISTSTTSFCLGKVRGLTIYLLYQLRNGPRRCSELAEITGKPYKHVWQYLKNMQNYGLIRKRGSFYEITILGADFLNYYMSHINHIISISKEYQKKVKRKSKEHQKKIKSWRPKIVKQLSIHLWLQEFSVSLDDTEKEVVEVLLTHYNRTGSKFILVKDMYELAERIGVSPSLLNSALKRLKEDNIIYVWRSRALGCWKIGLKKDFIKQLEFLQKQKEEADKP